MWHIIQCHGVDESGTPYGHPASVAQFDTKWFANLYKFMYYDLFGSDHLRMHYRWIVIHDDDLP